MKALKIIAAVVLFWLMIFAGAAETENMVLLFASKGVALVSGLCLFLMIQAWGDEFEHMLNRK